MTCRQRVCRTCYSNLANKRRLAFVIDWILFVVLFAALGFVIYAGIQENPSTQGVHRALDLLLLGICIPLFAIKDGFWGQSPGKWICGVQVIKRGSLEPIGLWSSFIRNTPIVAFSALYLEGDMFPRLLELGLSTIAFIGLLSMASDLKEGPRWGDGLAGTMVVPKAKKHRVPFSTVGALCIVCGYSLQGNVSGVCPECGTTRAGPPIARIHNAERSSGVSGIPSDG